MTFPSAEALEEYTRKKAAYFPRYHGAAGRLLKCVLRKPQAPRDMDVGGTTPEKHLAPTEDLEKENLLE